MTKPCSPELIKQVVPKLHWLRRLQAARARPWPAGDTLSSQQRLQRFTNFPLYHLWDKYRFLQTHLLLREAALFNLHGAPSLMDNDVAHFPGLPTVSALKKPAKSIHD